MRTALDYAHLSELAYHRPGDMLGRDSLLADRQLGSEIACYHDEASGGDAYLVEVAAPEGHKQGEVAIVFRGTQKNYRDILTDLEFRPVEKTIGHRQHEVHEGFWRQYAALKHQFRADLDDFHHRGYKIVAAGHSLGGALAVLAASDGQAEMAVTFGAPRVFKPGGRFYSPPGITHHRYVRGADIVPLLPILALGFRHDCRSEYLIAGELIPGAKPWFEIAGRAASLLTIDFTLGRWFVPTPRRMFTDHRIGGYIAALREIFSEKQA